MTMQTPEPVRICSHCGVDCSDYYVDTLNEKNERLSSSCHKCDSNRRFDDYVRTARISTRLLTEVAIRTVHLEYGHSVERANLVLELQKHRDDIQGKVQQFDGEVWFGGLQSIVQKSTMKGMQARELIESSCGPVKLMTYAIAGRAMFTLDAPKCSITLITDETSPSSRMGVQGIDATAAEAIELISSVCLAWKNGQVVMENDADVGLLI